MDLNKKKILFISPHFFGYEKAIVSQLKEWGAEVDFYNERPSDSALSKGLIRVNSIFFQKQIDRYYSKILRKIGGKTYDYFLLIKGESIPYFFLKKFNTHNPSTKKIFYSYDAVAEYPKIQKLYSYFDFNFTFEPQDSENFNVHFRPLFFLNEYSNRRKVHKPKYDIVFIGSAHTDRYLIGEKIYQLCVQYGLKSFFYYYAQGKTIFLLKRVFDKHFQKFDINKLNFNKLKHSEIAEIYDDSLAVLDINKPFQAGLTIRTFEALASGKKLITTNSDIQNYPFYTHENIYIVDRTRPEIDLDFFKSSFHEMDPEVLSQMTLESFLHCLLLENQDKYWNAFRKEKM